MDSRSEIVFFVSFYKNYFFCHNFVTQLIFICISKKNRLFANKLWVAFMAILFLCNVQ